MNILLTLGALLIVGYLVGLIFEKLGLPKIIAYIFTGIAFSPNTFDVLDMEILGSLKPLLTVCLAFIAFEIGGSLKLSKLRARGKQILSITLLESTFPFIIISTSIYFLGSYLSDSIGIQPVAVPVLALMLGALACPTDPTATFAVMHQYKAKGPVSDTIVGVAAMDDSLGILIFTFAVGVISVITGDGSSSFGRLLLGSLEMIGLSILLGFVLGFAIKYSALVIKTESQGQWVVIVFALIILCTGLAEHFELDEVLASLCMGMFVVNRSGHQRKIFMILERYSEEIIFLFFFLLSGLYLNIAIIPKASPLILLFVVLRTIGKFTGTYTGAIWAKAPLKIRKYTAGGLLPQGGIVIGLVLSIYEQQRFDDIAEILLASIMGAIFIHELMGPLLSRYTLKKAGELKA